MLLIFWFLALPYLSNYSRSYQHVILKMHMVHRYVGLVLCSSTTNSCSLMDPSGHWPLMAHHHPWWILYWRQINMESTTSNSASERGENERRQQQNLTLPWDIMNPLARHCVSHPSLVFLLLVSMLDGCKVMYWNPFQQSKPYVTPYLFCMITRNQGIFLRSAAMLLLLTWWCYSRFHQK